jgi:hypothetical protein
MDLVLATAAEAAGDPDFPAQALDALHLYQELGFTEYGRLKKFAAFGDRRYDKVLLSLDLRGTAPA